MRRTIRVLLIGATLALSVALSAPAMAASGLKLHPSGFGEKSGASWQAGEGRADSKGNARHALFLRKLTATATFAAGVAVVNNAEGLDVAGLTLAWDRRADGHCGAGAPRWNVIVQGQSGASYTVFLGCAGATHTPDGVPPVWFRDTFVFGSPDTVSYMTTALGFTPGQVADIEGGTVQSLAIVFDEGTDVGPGFVYLDNIQVGDKIWTGPMDNGNS